MEDQYFDQPYEWGGLYRTDPGRTRFQRSYKRRMESTFRSDSGEEYLQSDLGDTVDGLYDLLGRCSKVYTPYIEEGAAKAKLNQYEENLRSAGYGEILKKTVRRRMGKPRNPVALEASASKITEFPDRERKS